MGTGVFYSLRTGCTGLWHLAFLTPQEVTFLNNVSRDFQKEEFNLDVILFKYTCACAGILRYITTSENRAS